MVKNNRIDDCAGSLDTNVLLRHVLDDNESQTRAIQTMLAQGGNYVVTDSALFEMIFVLERTYKFERDEVCDSVYAIIRNERFVCNNDFVEKVLKLYVGGRLSIIDCAILEYAREHQALPLKTFDKDIIKRSRGDAAAPGV